MTRTAPDLTIVVGEKVIVPSARLEHAALLHETTFGTPDHLHGPILLALLLIHGYRRLVELMTASEAGPQLCGVVLGVLHSTVEMAARRPIGERVPLLEDHHLDEMKGQGLRGTYSGALGLHSMMVDLAILHGIGLLHYGRGRRRRLVKTLDSQKENVLPVKNIREPTHLQSAALYEITVHAPR